MTNGVLDDPVTGTRIVLRWRSGDTQGRAVVVEMFLQPQGRPFAAHLHPRQEETIDVLHGVVGFRIGRGKILAGPGRRVRVPAGVAHEFRNRGDGVAHVVCELRPALTFESLLEAVFGRPGETGPGNPLCALLGRVAIANEHFDTARAPFPPAAVQRPALRLGAGLGRLLGCEP
jgi:quercetin dioxygenase-like cupin family protein